MNLFLSYKLYIRFRFFLVLVLFYICHPQVEVFFNQDDFHLHLEEKHQDIL